MTGTSQDCDCAEPGCTTASSYECLPGLNTENFCFGLLPCGDVGGGDVGASVFGFGRPHHSSAASRALAKLSSTTDVVGCRDFGDTGSFWSGKDGRLLSWAFGGGGGETNGSLCLRRGSGGGGRCVGGPSSTSDRHFSSSCTTNNEDKTVCKTYPAHLVKITTAYIAQAAAALDNNVRLAYE